MFSYIMSPSNWGPSTWVFMHTLVANLKEDKFSVIGQSLILLLIQISSNLPCPECAQHAKEFWSKVKTANIKNKTDLTNLLFVFHNTVNKRKGYPQFRYENLGYYNTKNIIDTYNIFAKNFNTKGNMKLISDSFHRSMLLSSLRTWLLTNVIYFDK